MKKKILEFIFNRKIFWSCSADLLTDLLIFKNKRLKEEVSISLVKSYGTGYIGVYKAMQKERTRRKLFPFPLESYRMINIDDEEL